MRHFGRRISVWLVAFSILLSHAAAQIDWPVLKTTQVIGGASFPTQLTSARDGSGRLFVTEQAGRIRIVQNGAFLSTPFLDIHSNVLRSSEEGLLSMAFPPGFATKRYFYIAYSGSYRGSSATIVSRVFLTANANLADPASEQVVLAIPQPFSNHKSGQLAFGPDGYLYIGVGDGGSENDPNNQGQTTLTLLGKLLRIDVESGVSPYTVPATNPFKNNPAYSPEIWAYGLRNPWRFSFDRQTGDLYIADVGQNSWEEVDFQPANSAGGQNYGWRVREGSNDFNVPSGFDESTLTDPVVQYPHNGNTGGFAVIGGFVYRGPTVARMNGVYFFGDYSMGRVWGMSHDAGGWHLQKLLGTLNSTISCFGEDEAGHIYVAAYGTGAIYLLEDSLVVNTPVFSPVAGTYDAPVDVQLLADTNATIYYTLDGTTPTASSASVVSGSMVTVTPGQQLKAFARKAGLTDSPMASGVYTFQAAAPKITPESGIFLQTLTISMATTTPGAATHYTLDGTTPTAVSPVYTSPLLITPPAFVQAKSICAGYTDSYITSQRYGLLVNENSTVTTLAGGIQGFADGLGSAAQFSNPEGLCIDASGTLYLADESNNAIRMISPNGQVDTLAGSLSGGFLDGTGTAAKFNSPTCLCFDLAGNLIVADYDNDALRKVTLTGQVTTIVSNSQLSPRGPGLLVDGTGTIYYGRFGQIYKVVGTTFSAFTGPDSSWQASVGFARDSAGKFFVSNTANTICNVSVTGAVTPFEGSAVPLAFSDGTPSEALFYSAGAMCFDSRGNLYVCDYYRVRKIRPNGNVSTLAGSDTPGFADGPGSSAKFDYLTGICVDAQGVVYVSDSLNNAIRKIVPYDWDEDGIPDALEGGSTPYVVGVDDRLVDSDGDGISNAAEFLAGTNPLDASSRFQITAVVPDGVGNIQIAWPTIAGKRYQVQFSNDLSNWQNLGTIVVGDGSAANLTDRSASYRVPQRFYRIIVGVP